MHFWFSIVRFLIVVFRSLLRHFECCGFSDSYYIRSGFIGKSSISRIALESALA